VLQVLRAQLAEQARLLRAHFLDRGLGLFLEARLLSVEVVEAPRHLAGELDVRHLVLPHRHVARAVDQDVGRLQQRVAEEAVGREITVGELFLLVLVRRDALEPAERRHHREQQVQLGVLGDLRLDEEDRLVGVDAGGEPVDHHVPAVLLDVVRLLVVGGECVPVGDEIQAQVFGLQAHPVLEHAVVVTEVQASRGPHAGEDAGFVHSYRFTIARTRVSIKSPSGANSRPR